MTVFSVRGDRLIRRQVISSGGQFPVSVAVHDGLVYVLNALDGGSVQGYRSVEGRLVKVLSWHRGLDLGATGTPAFTHTPAQLDFTPDGSRLVITTKAGGNSIMVFPVGSRGLAAQPVTTSAPGAVPFGLTFDGAGRLVVTEAGPNAVATYRVGSSGRLTKLDEKATDQAGTCWIVRAGSHLYASNAGSGSITGLSVGADGAITTDGTTATGPGTVDAAVSGDGRFLYVQTGGPGGVDAFRIEAGGVLRKVGSVTVPDAVGGEGIVAL
ncbi:lactonase family protein [Streptomyces sp. NPDC101225]|uniref:lactonase family protein n=1 Tax=Streptomyces sp. NPDC101225 TaxID=3366135 RepID=UPI0037F5C3BE